MTKATKSEKSKQIEQDDSVVSSKKHTKENNSSHIVMMQSQNLHTKLKEVSTGLKNKFPKSPILWANTLRLCGMILSIYGPTVLSSIEKPDDLEHYTLKWLCLGLPACGLGVSSYITKQHRKKDFVQSLNKIDEIETTMGSLNRLFGGMMTLPDFPVIAPANRIKQPMQKNLEPSNTRFGQKLRNLPLFGPAVFANADQTIIRQLHKLNQYKWRLYRSGHELKDKMLNVDVFLHSVVTLGMVGGAIYEHYDPERGDAFFDLAVKILTISATFSSITYYTPMKSYIREQVTNFITQPNIVGITSKLTTEQTTENNSQSKEPTSSCVAKLKSKFPKVRFYEEIKQVVKNVRDGSKNMYKYSCINIISTFMGMIYEFVITPNDSSKTTFCISPVLPITFALDVWLFHRHKSNLVSEKRKQIKDLENHICEIDNVFYSKTKQSFIHKLYGSKPLEDSDSSRRGDCSRCESDSSKLANYTNLFLQFTTLMLMIYNLVTIKSKSKDPDALANAVFNSYLLMYLSCCFESVSKCLINTSTIKQLPSSLCQEIEPYAETLKKILEATLNSNEKNESKCDEEEYIEYKIPTENNAQNRDSSLFNEMIKGAYDEESTTHRKNDSILCIHPSFNTLCAHSENNSLHEHKKEESDQNSNHASHASESSSFMSPTTTNNRNNRRFYSRNDKTRIKHAQKFLTNSGKNKNGEDNISNNKNENVAALIIHQGISTNWSMSIATLDDNATRYEKESNSDTENDTRYEKESNSDTENDTKKDKKDDLVMLKEYINYNGSKGLTMTP